MATVSDLGRRAAAEAIGTVFLLAGIVGSGIMGERLAGGNAAIALLANSTATGGVLFALIVALGPISGAHFNPAVTMVAFTCRDLNWRAASVYVAAQIAGAIVGVMAAHAMFDLPLVQASHHGRHGAGQWLAEIVATTGLLTTIRSCRAQSVAVVAAAVAAYIVAAYWFTASTSFANPAVTIARGLTDTFAGIRPEDAPAFILAQIAAVAIVAAVGRLAGGAGGGR